MKMPKKPVINGYMLYAKEWKSKYGKHLTFAEALIEAGIIWASMPNHERAPYNERAKQERLAMKSRGASKLTCTGKPVEEVERELKEAKDEKSRMQCSIQRTVQNSLKKSQLETQSYYFIMVNYFVKTLKGNNYVPAEISIAQYSLKEGVFRKYHTFVNPGSKMYGLQYDAQHHADNTHKLPLPPNAMGESNLGLIYSNIMDFVRNQETGEYPPLYSFPENKQIIESVLDYLKTDSPNNIALEVYDIKFLFYILKKATCEMGEISESFNQNITDAFLIRDSFEFEDGLACTYHEDIDKSKYCTHSCVTRWGFIFSDYMCKDIAINLIPGRHAPLHYKLNAKIISPPRTSAAFAETDSHVSVITDSSYFTKAISENKIYYDSQKLFQSARTNNTARSLRTLNNDDFPDLGCGQRLKKNLTMQKTSCNNTSSEKRMEVFDDSADDLNPWSTRSQYIPCAPDISHFHISYTHEVTTDNETRTSVGYGRGRIRSNQFSVSNTTRSTVGLGRGRLYHRL